jgi:diaminopimelate epimerase
LPIPFAKLHGAGNDYIAIDGRDIDRDWAKLAVEMSKPAFGVGSDGIVVVQRSKKAQMRMRIFNPDGSEAEMSGNGIRLFAKFVLDRKLALPGADGGLVIETGGGVRTLWPRMQDGKMVSARVSMGAPTFVPKEIPVDGAAFGNPDRVYDAPLKTGDRTLKVTCLAIGNPHCVVFADGPVEKFPLLELGPLVERHKAFPNRVNFEIVNVLDKAHIRARIFERGAGETMSSGTGSTAAMIASRIHGFVGDEVEVLLPGGTLKITWPGKGEAFLEGPAVEVFTGVWPD